MRYTVRPISDRTAFTGRHRASPFQSTWSSTEILLDHEVRQVKGRDVVIEIDVPASQIRVDGTLYARAQAATPAVRLALETSQGPMVYATDRFSAWQDNVRAIALGMEALRRVERYGIAERGEQYAGFKQLGAGRAMPSSHMTSEQAYDTLAEVLDLADIASLDITDAELIRRARRRSHPDLGHGREMWDRVEQAAAVLGVLL